MNTNKKWTTKISNSTTAVNQLARPTESPSLKPRHNQILSKGAGQNESRTSRKRPKTGRLRNERTKEDQVKREVLEVAILEEPPSISIQEVPTIHIQTLQFDQGLPPKGGENLPTKSPSKIKNLTPFSRHPNIRQKSSTGFGSCRDLKKKSIGSFAQVLGPVLGAWRRDPGHESQRKILNRGQELEDEEEKLTDVRPGFGAIEMFRRVARLVKTLCSVWMVLRSYAIGKGVLDDYLVSVSRRASIGESEDDPDHLTFNLEYYKMKKELEVPESTKLLLSKRPEDRTPSDIETILRLMRELASFRKYTRHMQYLFCRIVRYMRCSQNRVVLRKGHIGYNLYFIFTGLCSVVLDKDEKSIFVKKQVIVLKKGACFGEVALVQNTRRNATVVCTQDTEFLVVDKDLFLENGLNLQMEEEFKFRFNVFRNLKMISHWDDAKIHELSNVSHMEEFGYNRIIVKDSKLNDWLWFVVKGSCDIVRLVDLEKCSSFKRLINDPSPESRASLETLVAASRGSILCPEMGSTVTASAWGPNSEPRFTPQNNLYKNRTQGDKQAQAKPGPQERKLSEVDVGRIDDMLANLRKNQISDVLLSLKEKDKQAKEKENREEKEKELMDSLIEPGTGLFFKIDTLRDNQCFGLERLDSGFVPSRTLTFISRGCAVIHVSKTRFTEIADKETLDYIAKDCKVYPDDNALCERFIDRCNWDAYKREVVQEVLVHRERSRGERSRGGSNKSENHIQDKKPGDGGRSRQNVTPSPSPPPTRSDHILHKRPHTAFAKGPRDTQSKNTVIKATWEQRRNSADNTISENSRLSRPRTCPPRVSKQNLHKLVHQGAEERPPNGGRHPNSDRPPKGGFKGALKSSNLKPTQRYHVDGTNLYVKGSQRSLQIITSVRSPGHEHRLKMLDRE